VKSLVVYESRYGNTEQIARAIAGALEAAGPVRLVEASEPSAFDVVGADLLVLGGPTEGHGVSKTLRARVEGLPSGALLGTGAAAFDTRINWPAFLAGSAAKGLSKALERLGARLIVEPQSFLVTGGKPACLVEGEAERAGAWASRLASEVAAGAR
jgi:flavodoxin I